jgi:hypothetical protein
LVFTLQLLYLLISSFLFCLFFPTLRNFWETSSHLREAYYYYFCTSLRFQSHLFSLRPFLQVARWENLIEHIHIHTFTKAVHQ